MDWAASALCTTPTFIKPALDVLRRTSLKEDAETASRFGYAHS
jgi:hypothetical protein